MAWGIIADDLTGSCDVAGRLTLLGYRPLVQVGPEEVARRPQSLWPSDAAKIVVVNTRTRDSSLGVAVARARAAARRLEGNGVPVVYHKIDSTLRGHWAEELRAISEVIRPWRVLVCPAFPARGRFVRGSRLDVKRIGKRDALGPGGRQEPPGLVTSLRRRCGWVPQTVKLALVRQGVRTIRRELEKGENGRCVVLDAEREHDLRVIGRALRNPAGRLLWSGSAGLVRHVFPPLPGAKHASPRAPESPWLLVQGSRQPISREQFRRVLVEGGIHVVNFLPALSRRQECIWLQSAVGALGAGRDVAVLVPVHSDRRVPPRFARFLDHLIRRIARTNSHVGIFVTGGNTAEAVCDSLRARALRVEKEIRPAIPLNTVLDGRCPGWHLVTKAGGFGGPAEVRKVLEKVKLESRRHGAKTHGRNHPR